MDRTEFDSIDIEANAPAPKHLTAQLSLAKKTELLRIVDREAVREAIDWSQVEPGHTPDWPNHTRLINTLR